jgi:hypothetical protein
MRTVDGTVAHALWTFIQPLILDPTVKKGVKVRYCSSMPCLMQGTGSQSLPAIGGHRSHHVGMTLLVSPDPEAQVSSVVTPANPSLEVEGSISSSCQ